jgi:hypothetical protein
MSKYIISFFGDEDPIKVTKEEYEKTRKKIADGEKFIFRKNGDVIAISSIKKMTVVNPEPPTLLLSSPEEKPVSKNFLAKFKEDMKKHFSWS